ncbi:AraC family transcriptional regulator [Aestuariibaculum suncheonense]|uniref:Helix-turn-helix transcriptional regulator n=1 Tax=Aestuariibaculum suncheonense TaxID=1028745 RepID=A0A8J6UBQ3_9FLAO|nr:AraC family transcriptional regulator [Aestuariibaculum suncheonense]MBD0835667.1 helix-turn-helix transcriptional regulator [Aestuariibaculum suncheonense]
MKVLPFKIPKPENEALVYQEERLRVLYDQLHQHSEIQISYVEKGAGTLIVGDTINDFSPNDILVLGSDVPHVFRTDLNFSEETVVYTLFFDRNSFGKHFFDLPDMKIINDFFNDSEYGMKILTRKKKIIKLFLKLKNQNKVQRISSLLRILDHITKAEKTAISSFVYKKKYTDDEGKRMNDVFNYAMENYMEPITLEKISEISNMSKNAFCRYFKKRTNKTFFQFLIEIRIENACKLIYNKPDLPISSISELCGFQNTANFNRKFKEIKGLTPSHYRLQRF